MADETGLYAGRRIAFLTQHGKEQVVAPLLDAALGCRVERVTGFDTDQLGTFSRDIPRAGIQIEAARRKARIGMELAGLSLGLASEGSVGADPYAGMLPWGVEMVIFIDAERELEIVGVAQGRADFAHLLTDEWEALQTFARDNGFPRQQLVVRPQDQDDPRIEKGIADWTALEAAFRRAQRLAADGRVFIESDLRAHANPRRMESIGLAAADLARRMVSLCPACGLPGFWLVERRAGLPCGDCGAPTRDTAAEIDGCQKCGYREERRREDGLEYADPGRCDYCNP